MPGSMAKIAWPFARRRHARSRLVMLLLRNGVAFGLGMGAGGVFAAFSISHPDREPLLGFHLHRQSLGNQSAWVG